MEIERVKKKTKKKLATSLTLEQYQALHTNAEEILRGARAKKWAGKIALTNDGEEYTFYVKTPYSTCELCNKQFEDEEAHQIHMTSKQHKRNVRDTLKDKMRILDEQMASQTLQSKKTRKLYKYTTQEPDNFECKDHKDISVEETVCETSAKYTTNTSIDEFISWDILKDAFARIDLQVKEMIELHKNTATKSDDSEDNDLGKISQDTPLQSLKETATGLAKSKDFKDEGEDDGKSTQDTSEDSKDEDDGVSTEDTSEDSEDEDDGESTQYTSEDSEEEDDGKITQETSMQTLKAAAAGLAKSENSRKEDEGNITQDTSMEKLKDKETRLHLQVKKISNSHKNTVIQTADSEFEDHEKITKRTKGSKMSKYAPVLQ